MRQIKTILDQTPEGFDAQVNAAIQAIGAEHLREIRTLMSTPTAPNRPNMATTSFTSVQNEANLVATSHRL
jgi:hypothetical protein